MQLSDALIRELIFGAGTGRRFTQDTPVMPDVWLAYGRSAASGTAGRAPLDLLITPHYESYPARLAAVLRQRLEEERRSSAWRRRHPRGARGADVAYNQSTVVASLWLDELVRVLLPLTPWWHHSLEQVEGNLGKAAGDPGLRRALERVLSGEQRPAGDAEPPSDLLWLALTVGVILLAETQAGDRPLDRDQLLARLDEVQAALVDLVEDLQPIPREHQQLAWSVNRNRPAEPAIWMSTPAVKADAAVRVFDISCQDLAWAVIDSGIDAEHPCFRQRDLNGRLHPKPFEEVGGTWKNHTRVLASYDFTRIRALLRPGGPKESELPEDLRQRFLLSRREAKALRQNLQGGREVDWELLKPFLEIPHRPPEAGQPSYQKPRHDHGTHVAGILAADWRLQDSGSALGPPPCRGDLIGMCPDLPLYDLRVLDAGGQGDEFAVMAALQFVRYLNAHKDYMVIQGANLSLSLHHDVANYACGRTPVCEECERLVGAGIVVVAAAGNRGYQQYHTESGVLEGYNSISITDPGNADGVITVGATHRYRPHTYGVSYFSSRGPTGDGRRKPDLVAPGEKITAPIPAGGAERKDGTSMAAPHVSGAAALLMARHKELIGRPERVKQVLCQTATDLGRERYFQGSGMLDVLRALQAV